jgi:hypothetical protein
MINNYPAGTRTIRNRERRYYYFLVIKPDDIVDDIPQKEYFVYRFKVSLSEKNGIKDLKKAFSPTILSKCIALTDIQYATGNFEHPDYTNQNRTPLTVKLKEIPIYLQTDIRKIDINKDVYQMGSTPIIIDDTGYVPDFSSYQRRGNDTNRNMDF